MAHILWPGLPTIPIKHVYLYCQISKLSIYKLDLYGGDGGGTFLVTAESGNCNNLPVLDQPLRGDGPPPSLLTIGNRLVKLDCCLTN